MAPTDCQVVQMVGDSYKGMCVVADSPHKLGLRQPISGLYMMGCRRYPTVGWLDDASRRSPLRSIAPGAIGRMSSAKAL